MSKAIVILCSGGGGNLRFVYHAIRHGWIPLSKVVVIADRECLAMNFARQHGLANSVVNFKEVGQVDLIRLISSFNPGLIITTVHQILSPSFLSVFHIPILNLHYSLLPAFSGSIGVLPVQKALSYGSCLIGATVHSVTEVVDGGRPHVQIALPCSNEDELESAMNLIFRAGCYALLTSLTTIHKKASKKTNGGVINIGGRPALINPCIQYPKELSENSFWESLKL